MASSKWGRFKSSMKNFWRGNNVWKPNKTKKNKTAVRSNQNLYPKSHPKSKLNYNAANIERIYGSSNDPKAVVINNGKPMLILNSDPSSLQENVNLKPSLNVGSYKWAPKEEYKRVRQALSKNGYVTPVELQHLSGRNLGFVPSENIYESVPRSRSSSKKRSLWRFWSRGGKTPENNNDDDPKPRANMNKQNKTFKNIEHRWKEHFPNRKGMTRKEMVAANIRNLLARGKANIGFRPKNDNKYLDYMARMKPFYTASRSKKGGAKEHDPRPTVNVNNLNKGPRRRTLRNKWKERFPNKKNRTLKEHLESNVRQLMTFAGNNIGFRPKNNAKYLRDLAKYRALYENTSTPKDGGGFWSPFSRGSQKKVLKSTPPIYELEEVVVHDPNARPVLNVNEYMETNWPEEYYKLRKRMPKGSKIPYGFGSWAGENLGFVPGETKRKRRGRSRSKNSNNNND